ncbi:hypothetical protein ACP70R_014623 [Stipagrostis hirtigluma subsp. patula]
MAPPRQAPELMEELVEEVLIRCQPDDPARLVRAALVCKLWCRVVSGAAFRRRYRQFHGSPPVLGFFYRRFAAADFIFMNNTSYRPRSTALPTSCDAWPMDARHGRVLFSVTTSRLFVSNPIAGELQSLPTLPPPYTWGSSKAALLCTSEGCDHLDCPSLPFIVVYLVTDNLSWTTSACIYSSETGAWSEVASVGHPHDRVLRGYGTLVGNALYFILDSFARILEYNVGKQELSMISLPSLCNADFLIAEDGGLGFATVQGEKLCTWSREACQNGWRWVQRRVIDLKCLLPTRFASISPTTVAVVDGVNVVFRAAGIGIFHIHLKSGWVTKVGEIGNECCRITPYMSFYTPRSLGAASTCERPRASASDASQN